MSDNSKIIQAYSMVENAESALRAAKALLNEIHGSPISSNGKFDDKVSKLKNTEASAAVTGRIIEGIFDGQNMIGSDEKSYPVPANYASKSKLVEGDKLKLTIRDDGAFLYKQIGPVDRKRIIGTLMHENGQYFVVSEDKTYNVLLASVTYFKVEIGQTVTILVPQDTDANWAAIENIVTNSDMEKVVEDAKNQGDDVAFDISKA